MSSAATPAPELRTTTLEFGPFNKPLSDEQIRLLAYSAAKAIGLGYTVMKAETETSMKVVAVQTAPRFSPFTRGRAIGATAQES